MNHYPTVIFRASNGMFLTKLIHVITEEDDVKRIGIELLVEGGGFEADGSYRPELRNAILQICLIEMLKAGMPACVVFGPRDCVYVQEDGFHIQSDSPPRLGKEITADNYDPRIGAQILAEMGQKELEIGNKPLLPPKKKAVIL